MNMGIHRHKTSLTIYYSRVQSSVTGILRMGDMNIHITWLTHVRAGPKQKNRGPVASPHHPQYSISNLHKLIRGSSSRRIRYCDDLVRHGNVFLRFLSCRRAHRSNAKASFDSTAHLALGDVALDQACPPSMVRVFFKRSKTDQFGQGVAVFLGAT